MLTQIVTALPIMPSPDFAPTIRDFRGSGRAKSRRKIRVASLRLDLATGAWWQRSLAAGA